MVHQIGEILLTNLAMRLAQRKNSAFILHIEKDSGGSSFARVILPSVQLDVTDNGPAAMAENPLTLVI